MSNYAGNNKLGYNGGRIYNFVNKPVMIDCSFTVDATNGVGITGLKGAGVQNVFMHTSTTPAVGNNNYLNPNPLSGYALVQLSNNYNKFLGAFGGVVKPPLTGSNLAINATALTAGTPYEITAVGSGSAGTVTIAPVADVASSLASTWFSLYDGYGNKFIIWFSVGGVGAAPSGVTGTLVQQSIAVGDTAATIGALLVLTIQALPSGISGVYSFTASGTTTVTVVSTKSQPLPGGPSDGLVATGFTFAVTKSKSNLNNWNNVGLPKGLAPTVGQVFIATADGDASGGTSSGTVKAIGSSGIAGVEILGNSSLSLAPAAQGGSPNVGGWVLVRFLAPSFAGSALAAHSHALLLKEGAVADGATTRVNAGTNLLGANTGSDITVAGGGANGGVQTASAGTPAGTMSMAATAPAAGSVISLSFMVDAGSVLIGNE